MTRKEEHEYCEYSYHPKKYTLCSEALGMPFSSVFDGTLPGRLLLLRIAALGQLELPVDLMKNDLKKDLGRKCKITMKLGLPLSIKLLFVVFSFCLQTWASTPDAEVLNFTTTVQLKGDKLIKNYDYSIQVNNRKGDIYGQISIPFSSMVHVSKISGRVEDNVGKEVKKIKKSDLKKQSSFNRFAFYEDHFEYSFVLKHYTYPYVIHYSYQEEQSEFLYIDYWSPVVDTEIPTWQASLEVLLPQQYQFRTRLRGIEKADSTLKKNNYVRYNWHGKYIEQVKGENNDPDFSTILPSVALVPLHFTFDKPGSFTSWQTYGNWSFGLKENLHALPESEKQTIDLLIKGEKDTAVLVKKIYHYVQDHTRYVYVGLETGGMKPFSASYVAEKKYGDCKALGNYFSALLRYAGIPSYYCNVSSGTVITPIDTAIPSMQFDHIITCVPMQNDTIWVDCTSKLAFNYLGTFTQNRKALLIDKKNSKFASTPALTSAQVLTTRSINLHVDSAGFMQVIAKNTFRGAGYENLFYLKNNQTTDDQDKEIRESVIEKGLALQQYTLQDVHRDSTLMLLNYEATSEIPFESYGNEMLIKMLPFRLSRYEKPEERKLAVQLNYPLYKIDTLVYHVPRQLNLQSIPQDVSIQNEFGEYTVQFRHKENKVTIFKSIRINSGYIPLENYEAFYSFINQIYNTENNAFIIASKQQ